MRLSAWDLTIERGGRRLIAGLSFMADQGVGLIVTGPNGAGKSTLLRTLCGFLPLAAGGFALEGGDAERSLGEQAHYLGHADGVKGALTAGENLAFAAAMLGGRSSRDAERAALAQVGLAHAIDFPARLLSAGQRRRVALARLLIAASPALAARRTGDRARRRRPGRASRHHAGALARRRDHRRRGPRAARARGGAGGEARRSRGGGGVTGMRSQAEAPLPLRGKVDARSAAG